MTDKNTVEVVIDGRIYELSGKKSDSYLHEVAGYLNAKIGAFKRDIKGYNNLEESLKALLLQINVCDDYFTEQERNQALQKELEKQAAEAYSAKHDLINMQMKMEAVLKQLEETQREKAELEMKLDALNSIEEERQGSGESAKLLSVNGGRKK